MKPMDLDVGWVGVSLEVTVERRLEVLLLMSAAVECSLEVYHLPPGCPPGGGGAPPPEPLGPAAPPPEYGD